jgi:methionyl-tRNA synthetase
MTSKPTIPFSIWDQCDLRVGKILNVSDHPKADKLYILEVDFGQLGARTIVAGLKKHYEKEHLIGKQGIFIINLEPVVLRGVKSEGMTLAAVNEDESVICILSPEKHIELGSKIR